MVVAEQKLREAVGVLRRMGARRVLLFGSYLDAPDAAQDIDLAVEGIPLRRILDADVAVRDILRIPVDLVSREENPEFFDIIKDDAKVLHEQG